MPLLEPNFFLRVGFEYSTRILADLREDRRDGLRTDVIFLDLSVLTVTSNQASCPLGMRRDLMTLVTVHLY